MGHDVTARPTLPVYTAGKEVAISKDLTLELVLRVFSSAGTLLSSKRKSEQQQMCCVGCENSYHLSFAGEAEDISVCSLISVRSD